MNKKKIIIVDYGLGNIKSLVNAFNYLEIKTEVSSDKQTIKNAEKLVLPGVGAFDSGVKQLKKRKIFDTINDRVVHNKIPILGICLGMQLFFTKSEEGIENGFNWLNGNAKKFKKRNLRVPHMGWNYTNMNIKQDFFNSLKKKSYFYFVHSYYLEENCINNKYPKLTTEYGKKFLSAFQYKNLFACQFHPEKSQIAGLNLLKNFSNIKND